MCWDLNYATYTGKSNLENIIFMYNSSSSCLFVTHIIHWLRAWLNNWIMCMLHIITPCSYCKFKEAKLGTVKLSVFMLIWTSHDLNIWKYWWIVDAFRANLCREKPKREFGENSLQPPFQWSSFAFL